MRGREGREGKGRSEVKEGSEAKRRKGGKEGKEDPDKGPTLRPPVMRRSSVRCRRNERP